MVGTRRNPHECAVAKSVGIHGGDMDHVATRTNALWQSKACATI